MQDIHNFSKNANLKQGQEHNPSLRNKALPFLQERLAEKRSSSRQISKLQVYVEDDSALSTFSCRSICEVLVCHF